MHNDTLPHHNDNTLVHYAESAMQGVHKSKKSRPPSMSDLFVREEKMVNAEPITLQELQAGVHSYFESVSVPYEEFFGGHNHD